MLGSMVTEVLSRQPGCRVLAAVRDEKYLRRARTDLGNAEWTLLRVDETTGAFDESALAGCEWIVNAIGVTRSEIGDEPAGAERAMTLNALFPGRLGAWAERSNARILQIATDAVYSGRRGGYREEDAHDPVDVYGRTKSLGESRRRPCHHIRCSIVGPETRGHTFLLEWFLAHPRGARVQGYTNHRWNGVTTLAFARVSWGIIREALDPDHLQHLVPSGVVTKHDLLLAFRGAYAREDLVLEPTEAPSPVDGTLATEKPEGNRALWRAAGYPEPPTVAAMVHELATFDRALTALD